MQARCADGGDDVPKVWSACAQETCVCVSVSRVGCGDGRGDVVQSARAGARRTRNETGDELTTTTMTGKRSEEEKQKGKI